MKKIPNAVLYVIIILPLFSLINILLLDFVFDAPARNYTAQGTRFLFTVLLSYFLFKKSNIARWFVIVTCALAIIASIFSLLFAKVFNPNFLTLSTLLLVVYLSSVFILVFSSSAKHYFKK